MKHLIIFALLAMLLIVPTSATPQPVGVFMESQSVELPESTLIVYNTDPGYKMGFTTITVPIGSRSDFTLRYGAGSSISGYAEYIQTGLIYSRVTVSIGGNTSVRDFIDAGYDIGGGGVNKQLRVTGYAQDEAAGTKGFAIWDPGLGIWSNQIAYEAVTETNNLISGITVTSTLPTRVSMAVGTDAQIAPNVSKNPIDVVNEWVQFAIAIGATIYALVLQSFYWIKFLFWDHLLITIGLYIGITGAMAFGQNATKKGAVFRAIKTFIGYQMALFKGIIGMWQSLIDLVDRFRNIFRL
jgi:hypothetical protein